MQGRKYEILIRTNDGGDIPHFHIIDDNSHGKNFHTCVHITTAKYFHHTGKEDVLDGKARKELNNFMRERNEDEEEKTNW